MSIKDLKEKIGTERFPSDLYKDIMDAADAIDVAEKMRRSSEPGEERKKNEGRYALAILKAKFAVDAYNEAYGKYPVTPKGKRHKEICDELNEYILNYPPRYSELGIEDADHVPDIRKAAIVNDMLREHVRPFPVKSEKESMEYLKKHAHLHRLVSGDNGTDTNFLKNYAKNYSILLTMRECAKYVDEEHRDRLKRHIDLYEQYMRTKVKLLSLPEKTNAVDNDDLQKRRKLLEAELNLLKHRGVSSGDTGAHKHDKTYAKKELKTKHFTMGMKLGTSKGHFNEPRLRGIGLGEKLRALKVGAKVNFKNKFLLSVSGSAGTAKFNANAATTSVTASGHIPSASFSAGAHGEANAAKGRVKMVIGGPSNSVGLNLQGVVHAAAARAIAKAGVIEYEETIKNEDGTETKEKKTEVGVQAMLVKEYAAFQFIKTGSITFCGIKISLTAKTNFGALGGSLGVQATSGKLALTLGASLGLGADVKLSLDWSRAANWLKGLFRRRHGNKAEKVHAEVRARLTEESLKERLADLPSLKTQKAENVTLYDLCSNLYHGLYDKKEDSKGISRVLLTRATKSLRKAMSDAEDLKAQERRDYAEDGMAALICAKIVERQKFNSDDKERTYEKAMLSVHAEDLVERIKKINRELEPDKKLWDLSVGNRNRSLTPERVEQIVTALEGRLRREPQRNAAVRNEDAPEKKPVKLERSHTIG